MPAHKIAMEPVPDAQIQRLGMELRARRKALGINMTAAAEAAGMSRVTWHRLEKGEPSVACGSLLAAAAVLGMALRLEGSAAAGDVLEAAPIEDALPLHIRLTEFPGLRRLAWQVGEGVDALTPREAFGLYARNARHLDVDALTPHERSLLRALQTVFGERLADV